MARFLSSDDAERLLAGNDVPDGLPDAAAPLARLFASMRAPAAAPADPAAEAALVSSIATAIRAGATPADATHLGARRVTHLRDRLRTPTRTAAIAFAAVLASGTAVAAAATGSLPDPVQRAVSSALSHVHVSVPHPGDHGHSTGVHGRAGGSGGPPPNAVGPDAGAQAKFGLCTAAGHGASPTTGRRDGSVAFSNLEKAAAAAGMTVDEYCKGATPGTATTTTGSTATTGPRHGPPSSTPPTTGPHGPPGSTPVTGNGHAPTTPGDTVAPTAPHGHDTAPTGP